MMVAGVGMQFFNNYANNKKNDELQAKQREFQRAAAAQDFERMRKLQAESARIALELEEELHKERMNDINNQYDSVLDNFAHSFTISNWPLNVLPFIMKGESFGSLIHGSNKSINMHCIFTPSNCDWFNHIFYDDIDLRLESKMNNNWNAQSSHPIVYYGGAWNRQCGESTTVNLNDIDLLKINLRGIPTMVVTPYFDPWLHFRIEIWGMGKDTINPFRIEIPHGDIDFESRIFSYEYNKNEKGYIDDEDFQNSTINEFVPYLESLIGFVADKYFWSNYKITPALPGIIKEYSSTKMYKQFNNAYLMDLKTELSSNNPSTIEGINKQYNYIEAVIPIIDQEHKNTLHTSFMSYLNRTYVPLADNSNNIPSSYNKISLFIKKEQEKCNQFKWVLPQDDNNEYTTLLDIKRLNLATYLHEAISFIKNNIDRLRIESVSIYIKHIDFKTFYLKIYDIENKQILKTLYGYDYKLTTDRPIHYRNIMDLFKNQNPGLIICRYHRIEKLIETINNESKLIF